MKMTDQDYKQLADTLDTLDPNGVVKPSMHDYRDNGMSHKRFRWDMLKASKLSPGSSTAPTGWNVYDYLDDTHIDSALRHYCTQHGYVLQDWPM